MPSRTAQDHAREAAAERGTQAERDFATEAQAPGSVPAGVDPETGEVTNRDEFTAFEQAQDWKAAEAAAKAQEEADRKAWQQKLAHARMRSQAERGTACLTAEEAIGDEFEAIGAQVIAMEGSQFENADEKGVLFVTKGKPLAFYSEAGLSSVKLIREELGDGPWPFPVKIGVQGQNTKHGAKAVAILL